MTRFGKVNWSLRGTLKKRASRNRLRNLLVETLETRTLMAGDLGISGSLVNQIVKQPVGSVQNLQQLTAPQVDFSQLEQASRNNPRDMQPAEIATHHYYVDGEEHGMVVYQNRIALELKQDLVGPLNTQWSTAFGLTEMRPLSGGFSVYESSGPVTAELIESLTESGIVETVVPVFKVIESQSEAVLLNEVIVKLPAEVDAETFFNDSKFGSYSPLPGTPDQFVATLTAGYGEAALAEINRIGKDENIGWAAPNFHQKWQKFFTPNDTRFGNLWHLNNTGQTAGGPNAVPGLAGADVSMTSAWDIKQGSNSSIVIGILDDGVPTNHPDLLNYVGDPNLGVGPDTNGNGWLGDRNGWDFINNNSNSQPSTVVDGHGTAVAGIAAARGNNALGVVGAAYGSPVLAAKMFEGDESATDAQVASAIYYLSGRTFNGAGQWSASTVVNHSWGGGANSVAINDALTWATTVARGGLGVTQFWASGNSGATVGYPASLAATNPGIVVVGATNNAGELSSYHAVGAVLDVLTPSNEFIVGPGDEQIYLAIDTTDRVGALGYDPSDFTGTGANGFGGTSAAAPLAAGVGALAMARAQDLAINLTANQLRALVRNNTDLVGDVAYSTTTGHNNLAGKGLLNAGTLLKGIGAAQLSVHTAFAEVPHASSGWTFGTVFEDSINQGQFRIRNQGTQTLNITNITVTGDASYSIIPASQNSLALGESTSFIVQFNPTSPGVKATTVTITSNDPTNPIMTFQLESTVVSPDANGFVFEDRNGDGVRQTGENPLAGRTAYLDTNGNSVWDTTATPSFTNNTAVSIPTTPVVLTSTINVAGLTNWITDLNVTLNVSHTFVSDLAFVIEAPNGDFSILINGRGGTGVNLVNTVFDDAAATAIGSGTAPFTGSFRPETPLNVFNGMSAAEANGTWTLFIYDFFDLDGGSVNNWTLNFGTGEANALTDAFGFYAMDGLPNGNYTARLAGDANWSAPGGAPTSYPFTIPPGEAHGLNFAQGRNNRFYANVFEDTNGNGVQNGGENGRSGRTVFVDGNLNGSLDGAVNTNVAGSPGTAIPDNTIVNIPINVAGVAGLIQDLDVTLNISHTWVSDLSVRLISPSGINVLLFNRRGGSGDNLVGTIFDDAAAVSITTVTSANAPFTGSWRPEQPLSGFNGIDANGAWTLRIQDHATDDTGTLNSFNLKFTTSPDTSFVTAADGWVAFDLPAGAHDVVLTNVGWDFTVPANGKRSVNASGQPLFNQTYGERDEIPATIVNARVNHVAYTGGGSAVDSGKSLAVESGSPTLLSYNNLINSVGGIRGLVFDIQDLAGTVTAADFTFQMSPTGAFVEGGNPPSGWAVAPAPSGVSVVEGSPDRVSITWAANSIANRWLRVTVLANANTGLTTPQVYYVGHLLGETTGPSGSVFTVSFADITPIRNAAGNVVTSDSIVDIDKTGVVSFADISAMRSNVGAQLTIITIPAAGGGGGGGSMMFAGLGSSDGKDRGGSSAPLVESDYLNPGMQLENSPNTRSSFTLASVSQPTVAAQLAANNRTSVRDVVFGQIDRASSAARPSNANSSNRSRLEVVENYFEQLAQGNSLEDVVDVRK